MVKSVMYALYATYLDSNSWLFEIKGKRILIDPWLVGPLVFGNLTWLFKGDRRTSRAIPENIDLIVLSQGLEDHAHPPTLQQLDRNIPVVASPNAAKVVQGLGYTQIIPLAHGEVYTLDNQLQIQATPGSPVGPTLVENGYLIRDPDQGNVLYYEPHGYHSPTLKAIAPVDIVITPIIDLKLPLLGPVIQGQKRTLEVTQWLQPQIILPTAAGGDIVFEGLLMSVLRAEGSAETMRSLLNQNNLVAEVIEPNPWERVELQLCDRSLSTIAS
jgi:L-ascorbate metabolism protein UlaG (beta-lactamase superfamily)